jgi:hypothetical protein
VSVPLSTIVRMSTFDESDFAQLHAEEIRARIKLPDGFALDAEKSALGVKINSAAGVHDGHFKLRQIASSRTALSQGMFSADVLGTEYSLKLSAASTAEFRTLQAFVSKGRPGEVVITITPVLSSYPTDASSVKVWIDLLLSKRDGYFTLVEAAEIPMDALLAKGGG